MLVHPDVSATPDCPTVKFREPKSQVDLSREIPRILNAQGWAVGTYFNVQFVDHEKTKLFESARFLVIEDTESLYTSNPDGNSPNTKMLAKYRAEQIEDWWVSPYGREFAVKREVKWNPGKKVHEVLVNGEVIYQNADKLEAEKFRDAA